MISSLAIDKYLDSRREGARFTDIFLELESRLSGFGDDLIVRSNMGCEDGVMNFAGVFDSAETDRQRINGAIDKVIDSYFSEKAVRERERYGINGVDSISLLVQDKIAGRGGAVLIEKGYVTGEICEKADLAVNGASGNSIAGELSSAELHGLNKYRADFITLHRIFGDVDIEFVIAEDGLYLTQMRPKRTPAMPLTVHLNGADEVRFDSASSLKNLAEDRQHVINLGFIEKGISEADESALMRFMSDNKEQVCLVRGRMPRVAHLPNRIESHFGVPYIQGGD